MKQTDETKIAILAANSEYMKRDISEIRTAIQNLPGVYVTQKEHVELITQVNRMENQIGNLQKTIWFATGAISVLTVALRLFIHF